LNPLVGIVIGSANDKELISPALQVLDEYQVPYELSIMSAHRSAEKVRAYAMSAEKRGIQVLVGRRATLPTCQACWRAGARCLLSAYRFPRAT
jgi:phosphoribosylcarboxyaminoimidazole (NCAIR) mutase